jgi:hypothetical protein
MKLATVRVLHYNVSIMKRCFNYIFLILTAFFALASSGCGCTNTYAYDASIKELRACSKLIYAVRDETYNLRYDIEDGKVDKGILYTRIRAMEDKMKKIRMTLYWSKNIDLVIDDSRIVRKLTKLKKLFKGIEADALSMNVELARTKNSTVVVEEEYDTSLEDAEEPPLDETDYEEEIEN